MQALHLRLLEPNGLRSAVEALNRPQLGCYTSYLRNFASFLGSFVATFIMLGTTHINNIITQTLMILVHIHQPNPAPSKENTTGVCESLYPYTTISCVA
jgi:hypothetical protein